ncbi:MAG: hypothetical protein IPH59_01765 [bacterium]|nr:hypothetical protein [bacterium]
MLTWANPITLRADTCDTLDCGDANGDGFINISDVAQASYYLSHPNSVPTNCADGDGYDLVTHRDLFRALDTCSCQLRNHRYVLRVQS